MKRVAIVGCGGAGKSTLARQLGQLTHLPVAHLDAVLWQPGWIMTDRATELVLQKQLIDQPEWIIDGNYGSSMNLRFTTADTIIFLDFPRWLCLWRIIKRLVTYQGRVRPDMAPGCPERWSWDFLHWIWTFRQTQRAQILAKIDQYAPGRTVLIFKKPVEVNQFLHQLMPET
ncbi:DNA topology modulation protein [Spirosoma sp. KCTC 42546]|uniref:DNA topology modulation protein n=1 Tax=Spirosoma sp. KCTC 42546 TaxID=2520506 RepID=UPI001157C08C|nr:DNA topology modulation protein [Spirosoma sp. KCTC 42546]QDK83188.1 DNA topology modulation protein [Spirosoma sp. KCTC 42546]